MPKPIESGGPVPPADHTLRPPHGPKPSSGGGGLETLDDLKNYMIAKLGEKDGKKMYENFMHSLIFGIIQETRASAKQAEEAIKREREQQ